MVKLAFWAERLGIRIEPVMCIDEIGKILPGSPFVRNDPDKSFGNPVTFQQAMGIRQERPVDECQFDMIGLGQDLADPRADRTPALCVIIGDTLAMDDFRRIRSDLCH